MRLLAIGKAPAAAPESKLFARYAARIKPVLTLQEFNDGRGRPAEIKRREGASILAATGAADFLVALDCGGITADSPGLAALLAGWAETGKKLVFAIGGAEGLDAAVLSRADAIVSFGAMTWPHMLVRVMLAEQIYRAQMIAAGHPYHRAGRP